MVYDDTASRWYVSAFDSGDSGLFLKVSNDSNPLDGWGPTFDLTNVGGFPDYEKMGFNKDAIFIGYNDFGSGGGAATIVAINKADAIAGILTDNIIHPDFSQFRAIPPAQMHGDTTGGTEWFVSVEDVRRQHAAGDRADQLLQRTVRASTTRQPSCDGLLSRRSEADQPGGHLDDLPQHDDHEVQYVNGHLVTAMASGSAVGRLLQSQGPLLSGRRLERDPGAAPAGHHRSRSGRVRPDAVGRRGHQRQPGLHVDGGLDTEFLSMWVGTLDTSGHFSSYDAAPGGRLSSSINFRIGDYSSTVIDPTDGTTFWAANEYIGRRWPTTSGTRTITSFSLPAGSG